MILKKLPYEQFLKTFELVPRVAVNLLIEPEVYPAKPGTGLYLTKQNPAPQGETSRGGKEILLTRRKKPPFVGSWHLPGSFVLKGEALMDCVKRVAKEELGIKEIEKEIEKRGAKLVGVFDDIDGDPRGHVVDLVFRLYIRSNQKRPGLFKKAGPFQPVGDTAQIKFFNKLPKNIGFNHRETLKKLGVR